MSWLNIIEFNICFSGPHGLEGKKRKQLTTHDVVQLYVFKGWNFSLEFKRRAIAQENSLNERKWNKAGVISF